MNVVLLMIANLKLEIDIHCEDTYADPIPDFFKKLDKMENIKYKQLPHNFGYGDCQKQLIEKGLGELLELYTWGEDIGTPHDNEAKIIATFRKFLDRIIKSDHLILIDPYIFYDENKGNRYSRFVSEIFKTHLKKLNKVTFITIKKHSRRETQQALIDAFQKVKKQLTIETKFSNEFHDRF